MTAARILFAAMVAAASGAPTPTADPIFGKGSTFCQLRDLNESVAMLSFMSLADELLVPSKFSVAVQGYAVLVVDDTQGQTTSGAGTNPEGSYFSYVFLADQMFPKSACGLKTHMGNSICSDDGTTLSSFLGPGDAIAFFGCTPPPMAYFGFDMDIMLRTAPPPDRTTTYPGANFADALNHLRVRTATDSPFDSPIAVVHSADAAATRMVQGALMDLGVPEAAMNTYKIPSTPVRFYNRSMDWRLEPPDSVSTILRLARPRDPAAYKRYKTLYWPVHLYRAKDPAAAAAEPYEAYEYLPRANAFNEQEQLFEVFYQLKGRVVAALQEVGASLTKELPGTWTGEGMYDDWDKLLRDATSDSTPVAATRDACYSVLAMAYVPLTMATGAAVIGVLHTREDVLGAAYQEAIVDVGGPEGLAQFNAYWNESALAGSGTAFLDAPGTEKLFVALALPGDGCERLGFARQPWCVELKHRGKQWNRNSYLVGGERVYVASNSGVGPDAATGIPAAAMVFETPFARQASPQAVAT